MSTSVRRRGAVLTATTALVAAQALIVVGPASAATAPVSAADIAANTDYLGWHVERGSVSNSVDGLVLGTTASSYVLDGTVSTGAPGDLTTGAELQQIATSTSFEGTGEIRLQLPYSVTQPDSPTTIVHWGTLRTAETLAPGEKATADTPFISSRDLPGIPRDSSVPLSSYVAALSTLDSTLDLRTSGQGFWVEPPGAVVASFTSGATTTTFGIPALEVVPTTSTVTVTGAEIRPDASTYAGWHDGSAGGGTLKVGDDGLHLGGAAATQVINGLPTPMAVDSLADLVDVVGSYAVDVTSGDVHTQLPFFFGEGSGFTTLRTAAPVATGGFTPALDQTWVSSRDIPATATTAAVVRNAELPLSTLLDALAAQGDVRLLAYGVYAGPSQAPALVRSVSFGGTLYTFGMPFIDVAADTLFADEITWAAANGITTGWEVGDGEREFRPLDRINRDAMAAFLFRLAGDEDFVAPTVSPFVDVTTDNQFYREITWLADKGISTGWERADGAREFRPLTPINRDAMAAFLYRLAEPVGFEAPATSPFFDITPQTQFYREITWLADAGITTGWVGNDGSAQYGPLLPVARDAMAAFVYRFAHL